MKINIENSYPKKVNCVVSQTWEMVMANAYYCHIFEINLSNDLCIYAYVDSFRDISTYEYDVGHIQYCMDMGYLEYVGVDFTKFALFGNNETYEHYCKQFKLTKSGVYWCQKHLQIVKSVKINFDTLV
jgi:hypothetical protein